MIEFWNLLKDDAAVKAVNDRIKGLSSLAPNTEALVIATAFRQQPRNLVIVKNNLYTAQQLFRKLTPLLQEDVLIFNVEESLRVEAIASTPTMYARQMETLADIVLNNNPRVIITHPTALVRYLPSVETFRRHIIELKNDQVIRMDQLKKLLIESGYRQASRVDQPLTFSMRGDVVDVFTIQENYPVRIEFFDDVIDSIRFFDMSSQRTIQPVRQIRIVPASTLIYDEDFEPVKQRIMKQFDRDKGKTDFSIELQGEVERDISYLENHLFEHYLYRYRCFFEGNAGILDYIDDPDIVLSTEEEIETNVRRTLNETTEYITEMFRAGRSLAYFSVYGDYHRLDRGDVRREHESAVVAVGHDYAADKTRGNAPRSLERKLFFVFFVGKLNIERPCETVAEIRVEHQQFHHHRTDGQFHVAETGGEDREPFIDHQHQHRAHEQETVDREKTLEILPLHTVEDGRLLQQVAVFRPHQQQCQHQARPLRDQRTYGHAADAQRRIE